MMACKTNPKCLTEPDRITSVRNYAAAVTDVVREGVRKRSDLDCSRIKIIEIYIGGLSFTS